MKNLPNVRLFLRLMVDPGWAPAGVAAAFLVLVATGLGGRYDYVFHAAGGAAVAYFFWRCAALVPALSQRVQGGTRPVFALAGSCVVAVLWEFAEFGADRWLGFTLQGGILETLRDLAFGALGAAVVCVLVGLIGRRKQSQAADAAPDD
ncbi:MAG: hypothetical protein IH944_04950 [Armatimonadetes bacterium]|nr:hypothetical protein [Armatimonadota bacterium]